MLKWICEFIEENNEKWERERKERIEEEKKKVKWEKLTRLEKVRRIKEKMKMKKKTEAKTEFEDGGDRGEVWKVWRETASNETDLTSSEHLAEQESLRGDVDQGYQVVITLTESKFEPPDSPALSPALSPAPQATNPPPCPPVTASESSMSGSSEMMSEENFQTDGKRRSEAEEENFQKDGGEVDAKNPVREDLDEPDNDKDSMTGKADQKESLSSHVEEGSTGPNGRVTRDQTTNSLVIVQQILSSLIQESAEGLEEGDDAEDDDEEATEEGRKEVRGNARRSTGLKTSLRAKSLKSNALKPESDDKSDKKDKRDKILRMIKPEFDDKGDKKLKTVKSKKSVKPGNKKQGKKLDKKHEQGQSKTQREITTYFQKIYRNELRDLPSVEIVPQVEEEKEVTPRRPELRSQIPCARAEWVAPVLGTLDTRAESIHCFVTKSPEKSRDHLVTGHIKPICSAKPAIIPLFPLFTRTGASGSAEPGSQLVTTKPGEI